MTRCAIEIAGRGERLPDRECVGISGHSVNLAFEAGWETGRLYRMAAAFGQRLSPQCLALSGSAGRFFPQGPRRDVPRDTAEYQRHDDRDEGVELSDFVELPVHEGRDRKQRQQDEGAPQALRGPAIPEESNSHPDTRRYVMDEQTGSWVKQLLDVCLHAKLRRSG